MPDLLDQVVAACYDGKPWDELLRRLATPAMADLSRAIESGQIHRRWAAIGIGVPQNPALQRHPFPETIASEAVEDTVEDMKSTLLPQRAWDPAGPRSLEDSFIGWCLKPAANAYRRAHTEKRLEIPVDPIGSEATMLSGRWGHSPDPADVACQREAIRALEHLSETYRVVVALEAAGWSQAEIVSGLGISPTALRARLSRGRRILANMDRGGSQ